MTTYACTHIEKRIERDDYEKGCIGESRCMLCEPCNIESDTLPGLIKAIGDRYGLDIDDVWYPEEQEQDERDDTRISFNQLECADCTTPDEHEKEAWKAGDLKLWLADYDFIIEKRETSAISLDEFKAAGIKTHN